MRRLSQFAGLLLMSTALTVTGNAAWAQTPANPPTLAVPATPSYSIQSIHPSVAGTALQLNDSIYVLPESASIQWEDGSPASRNALAAGMRIRISSHPAGDNLIIDQVTILNN